MLRLLRALSHVGREALPFCVRMTGAVQARHAAGPCRLADRRKAGPTCSPELRKEPAVLRWTTEEDSAVGAK